MNSLDDRDRSRKGKRHTSGVSNLANSASTSSRIPLRPSPTIAQIFLPITSPVPHPSTSLTLAEATRKVPWDDNNAQNSNGSADAPAGRPEDVSHSLDPENRGMFRTKPSRREERIIPGVIHKPPWGSSPWFQTLPVLLAISMLLHNRHPSRTPREDDCFPPFSWFNVEPATTPEPNIRGCRSIERIV